MGYTITAAPIANRIKHELLPLMRRNFVWGSDADIWYRWGYEQTPYSPNSCWLVKTDQHEPVGFTTLMPRRMKVGERVCDVGQAANLNVTAEHRSGSAAIKLQRALVNHLDQSELAFTFGITSNAVAVLKRAGYADLVGFARWVKVLRTEHKLPTRIRSPLIRRGLGRMLDVALRWRCGDPLARVPKGWSVHVDPPFDERFDDLWEVASWRFPIATVRDRQYLNWRFGLDPHCSCHSLAVADSGGRLHGYLIYHLIQETDLVSVCEIVDLLPLDESALRLLLLTLSNRLRATGCARIEMLYCGAKWVQRMLARCGFFRRPSQHHLLVRWNQRLSDRNAELLIPEAWHMTYAEAKF
jgi:hypothetical protein